MVNGSRYYRALESISIVSALSSALTIYPRQIPVGESIIADSLNSNFLLLGRSGGRPQRTVHPRRLPVDTVIHTTLVGLEPTMGLRGSSPSSFCCSPPEFFCKAIHCFKKYILRTKIKTAVTGCHILRLKCTEIDFFWGSGPDPAGEAYSAPPDPLAGFKRSYV